VVPAPAGERVVYLVGNSEGRDRIWLQCDAAGSGQAMATVAAVLMDSLTSDVPNRYRPLLLGRAQIAVVPPAPAGAPSAPEVWPALDAGAVPGGGPLLRAMEGFYPSLVVHLQDLSPALTGVGPGGQGPGPSPLAGAGLRLLESFYLAPDLLRRLGAVEDGGARLRTWLGRPTPLARELAGHPDARTGARARRHVERQGYRLFEGASERLAARHDPSWKALLRLAPGRYVPRLEWRRLGAASVGELALSRCGALALCGQTFDSPPAERAGAAVALAEGAVIARLGLDPGGPDG
jgi:hypothetical protein